MSDPRLFPDTEPPSIEDTPPGPVYRSRKRKVFSSLDVRSQLREVRKNLVFSDNVRGTNSECNDPVENFEPSNDELKNVDVEIPASASDQPIERSVISNEVQASKPEESTGASCVSSDNVNVEAPNQTVEKNLCPLSQPQLLNLLNETADDLEVDIFFLMEQADQNYFDDVFDPSCLFTEDVHLPSASSSDSPLDRILNSYCDDEPYSDEESEHTVAERVKNIICDWSISQKVEQCKVTSLLQSLKTVPCLSTLPATARTLVQTPRRSHVKEARGGGKYFHFSIARCLSVILAKEEEGGHAVILWTTDGMSPFKSVPSEIWSILGRITSIPHVAHIVFPIGFFCSGHKPKNSAFLDDFIDEAKMLIENGITVNGHYFTVALDGFSGDAPAKALVLEIQNFNGKSACTRCHVLGKWSRESNRVYYDNDNAPLRTHEEFLAQSSDDVYHQSTTRLTEIPTLTFPASFSLDYLHLILLGCFRTLVYLWLLGKKPYNIGAPARREVYLKSVQMKPFSPKVFNRKPRTLEEVHFFKGTEWRQLLLYTGMVIFKHSVCDAKYEHFLCLVVAVRIILDPKMTNDKEKVSYARSLLRYFVEKYRSEYGVDHVTHNLHGLLHICDDIDFFKNLEECSAFRFENFLQFIKNLIRKSSELLVQLEYRLEEMFKRDLLFKQVPRNFFEMPQFFSLHTEGPLVSSVGNPQYRSLKYKFFEMTPQRPNNCCTLLGSHEIILISNFCMEKESKEMMVVGRRFSKKEDFFVKPCRSSLLGIFMVSNLSHVLKAWPVSSIAFQNYLMPYKKDFIAVPLLNADF